MPVPFLSGSSDPSFAFPSSLSHHLASYLDVVSSPCRSLKNFLSDVEVIVDGDDDDLSIGFNMSTGQAMERTEEWGRSYRHVLWTLIERGTREAIKITSPDELLSQAMLIHHQKTTCI